MSFRKYRYNIYPEAWNALDAKTFPWHEAEKIHSSQALAIDVFGTIISSPHQDIILNKIAEKIPENVLQEDPTLLMYYDNALARRG